MSYWLWLADLLGKTQAHFELLIIVQATRRSTLRPMRSKGLGGRDLLPKFMWQLHIGENIVLGIGQTLAAWWSLISVAEVFCCFQTTTQWVILLCPLLSETQRICLALVSTVLAMPSAFDEA